MRYSIKGLLWKIWYRPHKERKKRMKGDGAEMKKKERNNIQSGRASRETNKLEKNMKKN